jgi:hypothetical protein
MLRLRHLRHARWARVRRKPNLEALLAAEAARLAASATGINITAVDQVGDTKATGLLTTSANPSDGQTVTIGSVVYTFQDTLTNVAGHVKIGASETLTLVNLQHAINASGGTSGTDYAAASVANAAAVAGTATAHTVPLTAIADGVGGNSVATTETLSAGAFGAATLTGGVDGAVTQWTATGHAITSGEGPYVLTAATSLPTNYTAAQLVYVHAVDANTVSLHHSVVDAVTGDNPISLTGDGVGTITLKKSVTAQAVFELLKRNRSDVLHAAADIDSLR